MRDDMPQIKITDEEAIMESASCDWYGIQHARDEADLVGVQESAWMTETEAERVGGKELVSKLPWHREGKSIFDFDESLFWS